MQSEISRLTAARFGGIVLETEGNPMIETKQDILGILNMPEEAFARDVLPEASRVREAQFSNRIYLNAMLGYTNVCKNQCLYCGMRAGNSALKRFRIAPEDVIALGRNAADHGYKRIFLIAGEDPKYGFDGLVRIVKSLKDAGMFVSLACGEFDRVQYAELKAAGADEYVLKFEMSNPESFNRMNPSTTFARRMEAIETIRSLGLALASGNIIDWPGQTADELADDILLMKRLGISWAPVIPFLPALHTPLFGTHHRGSLARLYREIAILRLMMPKIRITAQQPGEDLKKGLADPEANYAAIRAGANLLFYDLLPDPLAADFRVIDERYITGPKHAEALSERYGFLIDAEA